MSLKDRDQLISAIEQKDQNTLSDLCDEINPYLLRILGAQKVFGAQADDIVQNTWLQLLKNYKKYNGESKLRVFMAGIMFNKIREDRRSQKKYQYEEDADKIYAQTFTPNGWWVRDPETPNRRIEAIQSMDQIADCLEGLSDSQREAFLLRELEEESSEKICHVLGISVSNLGVLLYRAKNKLKQCLEGQSGG